jgi:hypothetical protein
MSKSTDSFLEEQRIKELEFWGTVEEPQSLIKVGDRECGCEQCRGAAEK